MRSILKSAAILLAAAALTACGKAGNLTAASVAPAQRAAVAPQSAAIAAPSVRVQAGIISNGAASIISNNAGRVAAPNPADPSLILDPTADLDLAYADSNPPASPADEAAEDAKLAAAAKAAADEPPPYNVDDRMPY